jgi:hypothetical protein
MSTADAMGGFVGPRLECGGVTEGCALNLNRGYDESPQL